MASIPDFSHLFVTKRIEELPDQAAREDLIFNALLNAEVGVVNPNLAAWYKRMKFETFDWVDQMRIDLSYTEEVRKLRAAEKLTSAEKLRKKAQELSLTILDQESLDKEILTHKESFQQSL